MNGETKRNGETNAVYPFCSVFTGLKRRFLKWIDKKTGYRGSHTQKQILFLCAENMGGAVFLSLYYKCVYKKGGVSYYYIYTYLLFLLEKNEETAKVYLSLHFGGA